jgi:hypothetical protein
MSLDFVPESKPRLLMTPSIIPLMGFCYMLQYMDKLALSQATLLGLRQDVVSCARCLLEVDTI